MYVLRKFSVMVMVGSEIILVFHCEFMITFANVT